jgi:hypothetical protein
MALATRSWRRCCRRRRPPPTRVVAEVVEHERPSFVPVEAATASGAQREAAGLDGFMRVVPEVPEWDFSRRR